MLPAAAPGAPKPPTAPPSVPPSKPGSPIRQESKISTKDAAAKKKKTEKPKPNRPYEEIGASFNGNEIKIRVPKSTYKPPKLTPSQQKLQQTCTCADDDSVCSDECGFPSEQYGPQNKLNFTIPDDICEGLTNRTPLNSEVTYCKQEHHNALCNTCNVTPKDAPKGVQAQKKIHPDKDIFILRIGKQTDEPNRTGNIEVELVTPRAPAKPLPMTRHCQLVQCEEAEFPCCMTCHACRYCRPAPAKRRKLRQARCFNLCG